MKKQKIMPHENLELPKWPTEGIIEFRNLFVKYRKDLDYVLKDVSFAIMAQEKIGIVGMKIDYLFLKIHLFVC